MPVLAAPLVLAIRRWCLASAAAGALAWCGALAVLQPGWAPALFLFAPLVIVPLGLALVSAGQGATPAGGLFHFLVCLQPAAALPLIPAFALGTGPAAAILALPWVAFTFGLARLGLRRLLGGGLGPADELCTTAALLYPAVGGVWLLLSRLGIRPLGFADIIVLATAVHFHYAGFALPLLTSRAVCHASRAVGWAAAVGAVLGVPLVAAGITLSAFEVRVLEAPAAGLLAAACVLVGGLQLRLAAHTRAWGRLLLAVSSLSVLGAMALAVVYALGNYLGVVWLDIPAMLPLHGAVNAFGFALPGLLAWDLGLGLQAKAVIRTARVRPAGGGGIISW
jgi:hypothetical protein